jgi:hypothetical protein
MKLLPPPGPARTRQLALLGVLVVAAAYALSRLMGSGPAGVGVPASNPQMPAAAAIQSPGAMPQPLALEKLEPVADMPESTRNPFRFGTRPAPPPPAAPPAMPPSMPPSMPSTPATPAGPTISLKFIGRVVLPDQKLIAVLADERGNRFEALEGQIVDGRYRIVKIGEESLVIEFADGTGRRTLQLR